MTSFEGKDNILLNSKKWLNFIQRDIFALQFSFFVRTFLWIVLGVMLAKSNFLIEEIGSLEIWITFTGFFTFFWINGLTQSFLADKNQISSSNFFKLTLLLALFFGSLGIPFLYFLGGMSSLWIGVLFLLNILFSAPSMFLEVLLLKQERSKLSFLITGFFALIALVLYYLAVFSWQEMHYVLIAITLVSFLRFCVTLIYFLKSGEIIKRFSHEVRPFLKLSYPLIVGAFLGGVAIYVDSVLVMHFYEEKELAVFRFGAREFPLFLIAATSLSNFFIKETASDGSAQVLQAIKRKTARYIYLLFPIALLFIWISPWLFEMVFSADFIQSADIFNIYLLILISRFLFPQVLLIGFNRTKSILNIAVIELGLNIVLSLLFFMWWGIWGIAFATVLAYSVEKVLLIKRVNRELNIGFTSYTPVLTWSLFSILLVLVFVLKYMF